MNKEVVKKYGYSVMRILIVVILLFWYNYNFQNRQWEYSGESLPSSYFSVGEIKKIDKQNSIGYLTYGPYIALESGTYKVTIEYSTDMNINEVDVFSNGLQETFYKSSLNSDVEEFTFKFKLKKAVADIEVRSCYMGKGYFAIDRIVIEEQFSLKDLLVNMVVVLVAIYLELKKKKMYELKYIVLLVLVMLVPALFSMFYFFSGHRLDVKLKGNFDAISRPQISLEGFAEGTLQTEFEKWWNEKFIPRGFVITAYNQIRYSCFDLGNRIIGKEKSIFEESYINDYLVISSDRDYSVAENQYAMNNYLEKLQNISKNLNKLGKRLLVYTTPSKAVFNEYEIPDSYKIKYSTDGKIRAIDYFRSIVGEYEIAYVDSTNFLREEEKNYPIFYKTGIHWSRPAEQEVNQEIIKCLQEMQVDIGSVMLGELKTSESPFWRDADVYDLLNIFWGDTDDVYYEYDTSVLDSGTVNVLIQGGSFAEGFRKEFLENELGENIVDIFYNQYVVENEEASIPITSWEMLDIERYIEIADIVMIEVNEEALCRYSNGFVEYLDDFLKRYISSY